MALTRVRYLETSDDESESESEELRMDATAEVRRRAL
jgi:hypothetical protein